MYKCTTVALFCLLSQKTHNVLILLFLTACVNKFVTEVSHTRSDSLIERVGQWLHGIDWHLAMLSCGKHGTFPHVLPCVLHH